jgi:hypothetical protein
MRAFLFAGILLIHAAAFAQTGTGAIVGRVLRSDGTPAANVLVAALELPKMQGLSSTDLIATGITDVEGRYRLADVPPGRYGVFLNARNFFEVPAREMDAASAVVVRRGTSVVHDLSFGPSRGITISGRVHGDLIYRDIQTVSLSTDSSLRKADVSFDGSFELRNVPPGTHRVALSYPQFAWGAREIVVEDQDIANIELVADDVTVVTGRVVTEGRGPVPRFSLSVEGSKGFTSGNYLSLRDTVRSNGMVGVSGWADRPNDVVFDTRLPIGEYRIAVTGLPSGYRVKSFTYGTTDLLHRPLNLTGAVRELTLVLSPPESLRFGKISGRLVRDGSLPPGYHEDRVRLRSPHILTPLEAAVGKDGSFEIPEVPAGVYWVESPNVGMRLAVGSEGARGVEFRHSRVRSRYEQYARAAANEPPRPTTTVGGAVPVERQLEGRLDVEDGAILYGPSLTLKSLSGQQDELIHFAGNSFDRVLPEGDYRVSVSSLEDERQVESVMYGTTDLRNEPLRIVGDSTNQLVLKIGFKPVKPVKVSGRLTGVATPASLDGVQVVLGRFGSPLFTANLDSDGRFEFAEVPYGVYSISANKEGGAYFERSNPRRVVVREVALEDVEIPLPPETRIVKGRIVVDGGYPVPLVALNVRPYVDAGPPFAHPYTMNSAYGGFVLQTDGRFAISLPDGRHRLRVDGYPESAYSVKSIAYGSTKLKDDILDIDGGNQKELLITFSAAPNTSWPKVKGRISGLTNVREPLSVVLSSPRTKLRIEAVPRADGSFEFPKVPPDTYTVTTAPRVAAMAPQTVSVAARDISLLSLTVPAQRTVVVRMTTDEGSPPSDVSWTLTLSKTEAYAIRPSFVYRSARESVCALDACTFAMERSIGEPAVLWSSPVVSSFALTLPEGEYRAQLTSLPPGYALSSFTYGTVNLLEAPFRVDSLTPEAIILSLSRR